MTKILLVEDDKSLREIYGVRLFAEGYDVVSAGDGEQALAIAIKERPALIITDVMMPKISGFDMLDILRSTTETKDIKVIVMTALGSEDNRDRGERLGADRYLVKSQVGIEDVVREVHSLLGDQAGGAPAGGQATGMPPATNAASPPPAATRQGMVSSPSLPQPGEPHSQQTTPLPQPTLPPPPHTSQTAEPLSRRTKVIQPINNPQQKVDIQALVDKELAKESSVPAPTTNQEKQVVAKQINDFAQQPAPAPAAQQAPPAQQGDGSTANDQQQQPPSGPQTPPASPPVQPQAPPQPAQTTQQQPPTQIPSNQPPSPPPGRPPMPPPAR